MCSIFFRRYKYAKRAVSDNRILSHWFIVTYTTYRNIAWFIRGCGAPKNLIFACFLALIQYISIWPRHSGQDRFATPLKSISHERMQLSRDILIFLTVLSSLERAVWPFVGFHRDNGIWGKLGRSKGFGTTVRESRRLHRWTPSLVSVRFCLFFMAVHSTSKRVPRPIILYTKQSA